MALKMENMRMPQTSPIVLDDIPHVYHGTSTVLKFHHGTQDICIFSLLAILMAALLMQPNKLSLKFSTNFF